VRHAQDDFADAGIGRSFHQSIQDGNKRFGSLEREAFLPHIAGMKKIFKMLGSVKVAQDAVTLLGSIARLIAARLHALL